MPVVRECNGLLGCSGTRAQSENPCAACGILENSPRWPPPKQNKGDLHPRESQSTAYLNAVPRRKAKSLREN
jgi:hypothetical protein